MLHHFMIFYYATRQRKSLYAQQKQAFIKIRIYAKLQPFLGQVTFPLLGQVLPPGLFTIA